MAITIDTIHRQGLSNEVRREQANAVFAVHLTVKGI